MEDLRTAKPWHLLPLPHLQSGSDMAGETVDERRTSHKPDKSQRIGHPEPFRGSEEGFRMVRGGF